MSTSVLTDRHIELTPVYRGGPKLRNGDVVGLARTRTPVEFDRTLAMVDKLSLTLSGDGQGHGPLADLVNIGAYVDGGTMVDTWATVGSGAQIGKNVHLSGGAGIGGVLEPPNAVPVVVEDEAFVGSRCMVVGGARVRRGATLGAGAILTPTTHVIDVETGDELPQGEAPAWSVCVSGTRPRKFPGGEFGMPCLLVLKRLPEGSRHDKATLNAILRDHGVDA